MLSLRCQVVNYRDYPPQDHTYVYKYNPFTSDIDSVHQYLKTLVGESEGTSSNDRTAR